MLSTDIPDKFPIPFANAAGGSYIRPIPEASQIGIQDGAASLTTGFVPLNFLDEGAGGVPPFGQDMNGIHYLTTAWVRYLSAGGPIGYDGAFSSPIGGYAKGAILAAATLGAFWISTADNNTSDPDTGGANWVGFTPINLAAADTGTANAGVIALSPVVASFAFLTYRAIQVRKIGSANTGAYTLDVGFGQKNVLHPDGTALNPGELPASGIFTVVSDGTNLQLVSRTAATSRVILSGNIDFYVSTTGSDSNNGLTSGTPWLTMQHAWNVLSKSYDLAGFSVTVHIADGTYAAGAAANGNDPPGALGPNSITFTSSSGNAAACVVNASGQCFSATFGSAIQVTNMTLQSSAGSALFVHDGGVIQFSGVIFGTCAQYHMIVWNRGEVICAGNYSVSGGAISHVQASRNAIVSADAALTITLTGTPAFSFAFANVFTNGTYFIDSVAVTFSGGATGKRYNVFGNGVIDTNNSGSATFLPGTIAGVFATGGQYLS